MPQLIDITWPISELSVAMENLARMSDLEPNENREPPVHPEIDLNDHNVLDRWISEVATWLGIESENVATPYGKLHDLVLNCGPALLAVPYEGERRILAVKSHYGNRLLVIDPQLQERTVDVKLIETLLLWEANESHKEDLHELLDVAGIPKEKQDQAREAALHRKIAAEEFRNCWTLGISPDASAWSHLKYNGVAQHFVALAVFYLIAHLLFISSWWLIVKAVLTGRLDNGTLWAWTVLLLSIVPFRLLVSWTQGLVSLGIGSIFKQRLLKGIQRLEPDEIRGQGSGQLLSLVLESRTMESLSLSAGFSALFSLIELAIAYAILLQSKSAILPWLLLFWFIPVIIFTRKFYETRKEWTDLRMRMTDDWLERMSGFKTRLVQEVRRHWHKGEDWMASRYYRSSIKLDLVWFLLTGVTFRGWLIVGLIGLSPMFFRAETTPEEMALALGGVLLAFRGFDRQQKGLFQLIGALIAWERVRPLMDAASRPQLASPPAHSLMSRDAVDDQLGGTRNLLEIHDLYFSYHPAKTPALDNCDMVIRDGEHILLEGSSGSGKSTLGSLLLGLRHPQSGLILYHGLDRRTLGETGWRKRISGAPQFNTNHIFSGTLAFNLLMGRQWPPKPEDLEEAEEICREIGLGPLLDSMSAGLHETVGENGWQLSHGEMSRVFIARALLQRSDLLVFDESFATLDPQNLKIAMDCVFKRAKTVIVIAHP